MNRTILSLSLLVLLVACAGSPFRTGIEAEQNRGNLLKLNVGLTKDQVLAAMGKPYKTEMYVTDGKPVEFWLYLTEGKSIHDRRLTDSNFTPLAFESGILKGWGEITTTTFCGSRKKSLSSKSEWALTFPLATNSTRTR